MKEIVEDENKQNAGIRDDIDGEDDEESYYRLEFVVFLKEKNFCLIL